VLHRQCADDPELAVLTVACGTRPTNLLLDPSVTLAGAQHSIT